MTRAAAVAVAVLSVWLASAHAQQSGSSLDLMVASVGLAPGESVPRWEDGIGNAAQLLVNVTNRGTVGAAYRIDLTWVDGDGRTPLNGDAASSFDVSEAPLPAKAWRLHPFPWSLQAGQEGEGHVEAVVSITQAEGSGDPVDSAPENNAARRVMFVQTRSFSLTFDPTPVDVEAGGRTFLRILLRNDGNAPESVALALAPGAVDERLSAEFTTPLARVAPQSTATEALLVTFDPAGDFTSFTQQFRILADPGFGAPRPGESPPVTLATVPGQYGAMVQRIGNGEVSLPSGQATAIDFRLENTGNRRDVFRVAPLVPEGWQSVVSPTQVALLPGESGTTTLRVQPATAAVRGSPAQVSMAVQADLLAGTPLAHAPVRVAGPAPTIASINHPTAIYVGAPTPVAVHLVNHGDAIPADSAVNLTVHSPGAPPAELSGTVGPLAKAETAAVSFDLPAPVSGGMVRLVAQWSPPGTPPAVREAQALVHDVVLRVAAAAPTTGAPGEAVSYRNGTHAFRVTNGGNAAEDVAFSVVAQGRGTVEGDDLVRLEPGQSWLVAVRHELPRPAGPATTANVTLHAKAGPVQASNTTATRIVDTAAPLMTALPLPARWNAAGPRPLPLTVVVEDDGAVAAVNATVGAPSGAKTVVPLHLGTDGRFHGEVPLLDRGNHTVRFAAVDRAGNRATTPVRTVEATTVPVPTIEAEGLAADGNLTGPFLRFKVRSELAVASLHVVLTQGNSLQEVDVPVVSGVAVVDVAGLGPGPAWVNVTASDASGASGRLTTHVVVPARASTSAPPTPGRDAPGLGALPAALGAATAAWARGRAITTTPMPRRGMAKWWGMRPRRHAARFGSGALIAAMAAVAILGADLLGGTPPGQVQPNAPPTTERAEEELQLAAWEATLGAIGLPELVRPDIGSWAQQGLGDLPPLDVPAAPSGPQPLAEALRTYARSRHLPDQDLTPDIQGLGLDPRAEAALSQLVLAFVQAAALQDEAVAGLTPEELAMFSGAPDAGLGWLDAHPGATIDDLEAHLLDLSARKVNTAKLVQAADLLTRSVEELRQPLSLPPLPFAPELVRGDLPQTPWDLIQAATRLPAVAAPAPVTLNQAVRHLATAYGLDPASVPTVSGLLHPTLDGAIALIVDAQASGVSSPDPAVHAATILAAVQAATPTLQAWEAIFALDANGAAPDLAGVLTEAMQAAPAPIALAAAARGRSLPVPPPQQSLPTLLGGYGLSQTEAVAAAAALPPDAAAALALILTAESGLRAARAQVEAAVGPRAALALQLTPVAQELSRQEDWSPWQAAVVQEWAQGLAQAPPELLDALADAQWQVAAATAAAAELLRPMQAPASLPGPGLPNPPLATSCTGPFSDCTRDILLEIEVGSGILVTGSGSTTIDASVGGGDPHIIIDLGGDDIYTVSAGASVNGFGIPGGVAGSMLDAQPGLSDGDLGWGYVYGPWHQDPGPMADNAANGRFLGILIDAAGDDTYASAATAAQGSAIGLGTIGILWDRAGDDVYRQDLGDSPDRAFQGTGGSGGFGLLVDERGADRYDAAQGRAQGAGIAPLFRIAANICVAVSICTGTDRVDREEVTGTGILVDLGDGDDAFTALVGQGHGDGYGTVGLLYDDAGITTYTVTPSSLRSQGGRGTTASAGAVFGQPTPAPPRGGGMAALIDLGGPGDLYNAPGFPASGAAQAADPAGGWLVRPADAGRKGDNVLWAETRAGLAFGLDSSMEDEDGDGAASLLELLAGSDPRNAADVPVQALLGSASELATEAQQLAGSFVALLQNFTADRDGDLYPNGVEDAAGTDPDDPSSTPGLLNDPGFLVTLAILCPDDGSTCASPCDPALAPCVSLLSIGGPGPTRHARPTIVELDLEGDDLYVGQVAGPGSFKSPNGPQTRGSLSIDVGGNDSYDTPELAKTQAYASAGASVLLDLAGQDLYRARQEAQGASVGGIAILADFAGDDEYESGASSQGDTAGLVDARGAALIDLGGNDSYRAATQASLRGSVAAKAFAILLDAAGVDTYAITSAGTTPFDRQGRVTITGSAGAAGFTNTGTLARALFMDLGDATDTYLDLSNPAAPLDESGPKNGAFLREEPGPVGSAVFSDGLLEDDDQDGFPPVAEALAGSDPKDPASTPDADGQVRIAPGRGTGLRLPGLTVGGIGDDTYLSRSDFMVDLGGNDHYLARFIGGTAPGLHGLDAQPFTASLVLDLGGDDEYRPAPCIIEPAPIRAGSVRTIESGGGDPVTSPASNGALGASSTSPASAFEPRQLLFCPSLGAAALGVSVLGDQGGKNTFDASIRVHITVDAKTPGGEVGNSDVQVRAWGLSLGASLFNGVGVVATWDGENSLHSDVDVTAEEKDTKVQDPAADAYTLAQGASYGSGVGLLISQGGGDDSYLASARARAPRPAGLDGGRERAYAQGAAMGGVGMLVDDGGDNHFSAPDGFAQGFAFLNSVGLLWSGAGDDDYLGNSASQGAAGTQLELVTVSLINNLPPAASLAKPSLAGLVDMGGNDRYHLALIPPGSQERNSSSCPSPPRPECALAQGAADLGGVALLADWAGDDRYEATGRSYVQGAGRIGGHATLFDASGNDVYRALSDGQGYAEAAKGLASESSGTLIDLTGRDTYDIGLRGQGYAASAVPRTLLTNYPQPGGTVFPFDEAAQFIDLGGQDVYRYGMAKTAVPAGDPTQDRNQWQWTQQPAEATTRTPRGLGIDAEGIDEAVAMYQQSSAPPLAEIDLCLRHAGDPACLPAETPLRGVVEAVVTATAQPGLSINRVSVLRDGTAFGVAQPTSDSDTYILIWDTRVGSAGGVTDGSYEVSAVAWIASAGDPGEAATRPDGLPVASLPVDIKVDNLPVGKAELTRPAVSPNVTATAGTLRIEIGADLAAPEGKEQVAPGAKVLVTLHGPGTATLHNDYEPSGVIEVPVTGWCGAQPCPDGQYSLEVRLTDTSGQHVDLPAMPLLIDGTAPSSTLTTPAPANATRRSGADGLVVSWTSSDATSGVASVIAMRLAPDGTALDDCPPTGRCWAEGLPVGEAAFLGIASGTEHHFLTVAVDALGNTESVCLATETFPVCPAQKLERTPDAFKAIDVDFLPPAVLELTAVPPIARPGVDVTLSALVIDSEGRLKDVFVSTGGLVPRMAMTKAGDRHVAVVKFPAPAGPDGAEVPYVFTVQASDQAGNAHPGERASAMIDSRAPRISLLQSSYRNGAEEVPRGRPGAIAQYVVLAEDHKTASVAIDASTIGLPRIDCSDESAGRRWRCAVPIPDGTDDGLYELTLNATDAAGNFALLAVELSVDSLPPSILNATVNVIAPDTLEVTWDTKTPTLGYVQYGRTISLGGRTEQDEARSKHHAVRVAGLEPAAKYYLRPVSVSEANTANFTAPILTATTPSAFGIAFTQFPAGQQWNDVESVQLALSLLLDPTQQASVLLKVQDTARQSSPLPVDGRTVGAGEHDFRVDTTLLPDGEYVAIAEASRQGDVVRVESPASFRIDNTPPALQPIAPRPGKIVGTSRPDLELAVIDPLRTDFPPLSKLTLVLDENATTPAQMAYSGFVGAQRKLIIQLPSTVKLADGPHTALVRMEDGAGNVGTTEWGFIVDSSLPTVTTLAVHYVPGAAQGRPGGPAHAWLRLADTSGVAAASIDLRPWGGSTHSLFGHANGTWSGSFTIPSAIPEGRVDVHVNATDAQGRQGLAGTMPIDVDARAPTLHLTALRAVNPTTVLGNATTDEPALASLFAGNRNATGTLGMAHRVLLGGLVPGQSYDLVLRATDTAGNIAEAMATLRLPADGEAPGAPSNAQATPQADGVLVTWVASADNAGVARYVVTRVQAGVQQEFAVDDALRFLDQGAPPGAVLYRIHAIDVAGLPGPAAEASIFVHAPARLDAATISPAVGAADKPFVVQVTYRHPAGLEPDTLVLHHAGASYALTRVPGGDCKQGCTYSARIQLPVTPAFGASEPTYLEALVAGLPTQLALDRPLVTTSSEGFHAGGAKPTPAFPFLLAIAALAAAIRGRRGDPR